jgi:hypothetical protein
VPLSLPSVGWYFVRSRAECDGDLYLEATLLANNTYEQLVLLRKSGTHSWKKKSRIRSYVIGLYR